MYKRINRVKKAKKFGDRKINKWQENGNLRTRKKLTELKKQTISKGRVLNER